MTEDRGGLREIKYLGAKVPGCGKTNLVQGKTKSHLRILQYRNNTIL